MADFGAELRALVPVPEALLLPLDEMLARNPDQWLTSDRKKPNRFGAFRGSTLHIVFQYPLDLRSHEASAYNPLWNEWEAVIRPVIDHVTPWYGYRDGRTTRIMLARLLAGREITAHVDGAPAAEVPNKIHVPLVTRPEVRFFIGEGKYRLDRGKAYEVNNRVRHSVRNDSDQDRIHLIFDYYDAGRA
jgi:hypothetical protein